MNSVCISSCINDAHDPRVPVRPVRASYVNLYKWPESDAEFVRSVRRGGGVPAARVVDSISCRQMYLRSYTFSREDDESKSEKVTTQTSCLGRVKETASFRRKSKEENGIIVESTKPRRRGERRRVSRKKKQEQACSVMFRFFRRLLSCAATVDVVDPN
ncbi:unnamed protein product [Arabidopsis lyrata]|uniref:Uncharacterized protein n=1 Tax=Arabidopsis lyrata subsp. lyrata TaxID=81972 RepID=D7M7V4_ARALL|nr:uncharacterized protein LOC9307054 [Arabidopsis lyrata subsp. lyrata]EFH49323.1 hypothetical protein ARALYDRAFT_487043 [Arabidopsis lyrata subsp. lyrata]CAH8269818.1 unnamed protein product [Arabidopsis lyrata]|eukprot:XP_002873064.1 uncharacterized protein LOC9307054 [Arabidopsis lyrata subsp. lyrata]